MDRGIGVLAVLLAAPLVFAQEASPPFTDRFISFSSARVEATRAYIAQHYGLKTESIEIEPRMVVVHWTALPSLEASWRAFNGEALGPNRPELGSVGGLNVSAHFLVDRDGTVLRLMPETRMARHVIGLNMSAIGIENVGGPDAPLTPAQAEADARLIRWLKEKYPAIRFLIGHYESGAFKGGPLWLEKHSGYHTIKSDPGPVFMAALRKKVGDLGLEGPPSKKR